MAQLMPGQTVIVSGNLYAKVIDFPREDRVRVALGAGKHSQIYYLDEVKTRAEALHSARYLLTRIAADLDDLGLMDAMEHAAAYVERAAQQADAADAVKGISA